MARTALETLCILELKEYCVPVGASERQGNFTSCSNAEDTSEHLPARRIHSMKHPERIEFLRIPKYKGVRKSLEERTVGASCLTSKRRAPGAFDLQPDHNVPNLPSLCSTLSPPPPAVLLISGFRRLRRSKIA